MGTVTCAANLSVKRACLDREDEDAEVLFSPPAITSSRELERVDYARGIRRA